MELRTVSTVTAAAIAVADMIGIGVFTSLGFQVSGIPSPFSVLMLWVVGGIAALCGALSYAELAAAFPRSGGEYNYLSRIYGQAVGFMAGWVSATVGFAAPVALAAMAFGEYFQGVVPGAPPLLLGLAATWVIAFVHVSGIKPGTAFHNASTALKLALIVVLIIAGLAFGEPQPISFAPTLKDLDYMTAAPFAVGLVFVMYAYSGWNAATYIAGEVRDPQTQPAARPAVGDAHRDRALRQPQRRVPLHHAGRQARRPDRRGADRRQAHLRRGRRQHRRRPDLPGPHLHRSAP